jgi:hypothetical protein
MTALQTNPGLQTLSDLILAILPSDEPDGFALEISTVNSVGDFVPPATAYPTNNAPRLPPIRPPIHPPIPPRLPPK